MDINNFFSNDYQKYLYNYQIDFASVLKSRIKNYNIIFKCEDYFIFGEKLEWDSKILGVIVARIDCIIIKKDCLVKKEIYDEIIFYIKDYKKQQQIELLVLRTSIDNIYLLEALNKNGFKNVDSLNTFLFTPNLKKNFIKKESCIRFGNENDIKRVLEIALYSFKHSRIYVDDKIEKIIADEFYYKLTKYILLKKNIFSVYEKNNRVEGFYIGNINYDFSSKKKLGYLWLIAVSKEQRGKKIGKKMFNHFLTEFSKQVDYIEISTQQENKAAISIYKRAGLPLVTNIKTYHYWN